MAIASKSPQTARSAVLLPRCDPVALAVVGVCGAAAALRFATLGVQSFDYDETFTVGIVHGSLGHALGQIPHTESTPPLYYVLAWMWAKVFGTSEVGLRSLSALLGTALVPVLFFVTRRLGSTRAGLIAASLAAVSPFLVWYSQEARTYALLALLCALSFWAFVLALDAPSPRRFYVWAIAAAAALLSHYFAVYLVAGEAVWLIVATRRRPAFAATAALTAVAAALVPLVVSQADNRTQWIEALSLASRIREVIKKWATGEVSPTPTWELVLLGLVVAFGVVLSARRLTVRERQGVAVALGLGGGALLAPMVLDLAGLHYLISKNVMPALIVILIAGAVILGAERAGITGLVTAAITAGFSLALAIDGALNPALQRPDYRAAARALGRPARDQIVVTPNLGNKPMALYHPGAEAMRAAGWLAREVVLVLPVPRADEPGTPIPTPAAPPGFALAGRRDAPAYTLICYSSPAPRLTTAAPLAGTGGRTAQVWPGASTTVAGDSRARSLCAGGR